jgi:hypothetical protein
MDYARQRFAQYWLMKPVILACHADEWTPSDDQVLSWWAMASGCCT